MTNHKVYVAGHNGMVGSAIIRLLKNKNIPVITQTRKQLNLTNQIDVKNFFQSERPSEVYLAAAKVGGIYANSIYPAEFIYENTMIEANIIHSAFLSGVKKLVFLGSSCIYPKFAAQPIKEEELLSNFLEPTNEPYAIAKIFGIKLCESYNRQYGLSKEIEYRSIMPTNLYGPGDKYDLENSHVIPALILKFHEALTNKKPKVTLWGTGSPRREFLHVDDLAIAAKHIMDLDKKKYSKNILPMCSHINVGSGSDLTIKSLAQLIAEIVGYRGTIEFDKTKPDGMSRKLLDSKKIYNLGWRPKIKLKEGLMEVYKDYKKLL